MKAMYHNRKPLNLVLPVTLARTRGGRFGQTRSQAIAIARALTLGALGLLIAGPAKLYSQPIAVPNYSFESQAAPNAYPYVNVFVDAWQKVAEPAYFGPAVGTPYGIPWIGTAGVFLDVNPYENRVGNQAGYILGFPQVTLFQDYNSSPTHDFNAVFEVGKAYNLTLGVFGKSTLAPGSTLQLSLYYLDTLDNRVPVGATTVTYSPAGFPETGPLRFVDYEVNVPAVQAGDAWAGRHMGIQLESTTALAMSTGGNWDLDNVRLTVVPEPASLSLLLLGVAGLLGLRPRRAL